MADVLELHLLNHVLVSLVHSRSQAQVDKIVKEFVNESRPNDRTIEIVKEATLIRREQIKEHGYESEATGDDDK